MQERVEFGNRLERLRLDLDFLGSMQGKGASVKERESKCRSDQGNASSPFKPAVEKLGVLMISGTAKKDKLIEQRFILVNFAPEGYSDIQKLAADLEEPFKLCSKDFEDIHDIFVAPIEKDASSSLLRDVHLLNELFAQLYLSQHSLREMFEVREQERRTLTISPCNALPLYVKHCRGLEKFKQQYIKECITLLHEKLQQLKEASFS